MKASWILTFLLCLWLGIWQFDQCQLVEVKIPSGKIVLPKAEKEKLEYFFRELIVYNCAGYTLLGNKPVSFDCVMRPQFKWDFPYLWHAFFPSNLKKYYAWKTWEKYKVHFCDEEFLIWSEPSPWIENSELIVIANRNQITRIIQENKADFDSFLLNEIKKKPLFKELLLSHDGLIGTLLGYGRTNAWLFFERNKLSSKALFSEEVHHLFENKKAALNYTFGWPKVKMSEILIYPMFLADIDSEESKQLKSEYLETRKKILDYYEDKDFLEATLTILKPNKVL